MKIVYLTDQIFLHGGVEKVLSQKTNYFAEVAGEEVTIVTYRQQNRKPIYTFSDKINFMDLEVDYEIEKSYFHPLNLRKIPRHVSNLKRILKEVKPDVIVSCSFGPDFYFLPTLVKHIPKIKEFHSSRYFYTRNGGSVQQKILTKLTDYAEKNYDQLLVLNESEKHFYQNKSIAVIPNPAEISTQRANPASKKIMAAGRISPVKNFGELIQAFSRLAKDFPEWELHFFGEDYIGTQAKLEQKIKDLGLESQIKFMGIASDLKSSMENYSIYAMTSESECFPMVLLEALSVGMPVISYDSPTGPKHILTNNEDSFLVPYKNLDIFTDQLKQLMQNENLRQEMGENALENVTRFDIEVIMLQIKKLFNRNIQIKKSKNDKQKSE